MKVSFAKTTVAATILMFAGASLASVQTRSEDDIVYGDRGVSVSSSQAYEVMGPEQQRKGRDLMWQVDSQQPMMKESTGPRIVDDRRMSTDLIYGS